MMDIGGLYFERRLLKSFNRITKFKFTEDRLNAYGCEKIFNDHMSGSKSKRPGFR